MTRKDWRHSGYVTPSATVRIRDLIKYDLFVESFYSDWDDRRDGMRDWYRDFKKIKKVHRGWIGDERFRKRVAMNRKQVMLRKRRKASVHRGREIEGIVHN